MFDRQTEGPGLGFAVIRNTGIGHLMPRHNNVEGHTCLHYCRCNALILPAAFRDPMTFDGSKHFPLSALQLTIVPLLSVGFVCLRYLLCSQIQTGNITVTVRQYDACKSAWLACSPLLSLLVLGCRHSSPGNVRPATIIDSAADWTSTDLQGRDDEFTYHFQPEDVKELQAAVEKIKARGVVSEDDVKQASHLGRIFQY